MLHLNLTIESLAYLSEQERIDSYIRDFIQDCQGKKHCERSLKQLNMGRKKPRVAVLN